MRISYWSSDVGSSDLLASEARLASYFAIAKGDIAPEHWFHLGRTITRKDTGLALVSWNGSLLEYLMPNIFLHSDPPTRLGMMHRTSTHIPLAIGQAPATPRGTSESHFASSIPHPF